MLIILRQLRYIYKNILTDSMQYSQIAIVQLHNCIQIRDNFMSKKLIDTNFQAPRTLLMLSDCLKKELSLEKVKVKFEVQQKDLLKYLSIPKQPINKQNTKHQTKKQQSSESSSDTDLIDQEQSQSQSEWDSESADQEDNKNSNKILSQKDSTYIFYPPSKVKSIFYNIYAKQIETLKQQYKCQIKEGKDKSIQIICEESNYIPELKTQLFNRSNNVHTFMLEQKNKVIIHSNEVERKLREKNIFMAKNGKQIVIWSLSKHMKEDQFKKTINQQILTKCRKRVIVFFKEHINKNAKSKTAPYLSDFFFLFKIASKKKFLKIQNIFNVKVELVPRHFQLIAHLQDPEFYEQVQPLIKKQFNSLLMFSITVSLQQNQRLKLINLCKRNYKQLSCELFQQKRFGVCITERYIKQKLGRFLRDVFELGIVGKTSVLIVPFHHFNQGEEIKRVVNRYVPAGIQLEQRKSVCIYERNIMGDDYSLFQKIILSVAQAFLGESLNQTSMNESISFNHDASESVLNSKSVLNNSNSEEKELSEQSKSIIQNRILNESLFKNNSITNSQYIEPEPQSLSITQNQLGSEYRQKQQANQQSIKRAYNLKLKYYPHLSSQSETFQITTKFEQKKEIQDFLQNNAFGIYQVKCIVIPQKWISGVQLKDPLIYVSNEQIIHDGELKRQIELRKIQGKIEGAKYLIQANKVVQTEIGNLISESGFYIPVYQIKQL